MEGSQQKIIAAFFVSHRAAILELLHFPRHQAARVCCQLPHPNEPLLPQADLSMPGAEFAHLHGPPSLLFFPPAAPVTPRSYVCRCSNWTHVRAQFQAKRASTTCIGRCAALCSSTHQKWAAVIFFFFLEQRRRTARHFI